MATVNFSVPEHIKTRFYEVFEGQNKSQIMAELMQKAVEDFERKQQQNHAIDALLKLRQKQKPVTKKQISKARQQGRP